MKKKLLKIIDRFLPHLAIALVLGLLVLTVLNSFNPTMRFLTSTASSVYYLVLAVTVITVSVRHLIGTEPENKPAGSTGQQSTESEEPAPVETSPAEETDAAAPSDTASAAPSEAPPAAPAEPGNE